MAKEAPKSALQAAEMAADNYTRNPNKRLMGKDIIAAMVDGRISVVDAKNVLFERQCSKYFRNGNGD